MIEPLIHDIGLKQDCLDQLCNAWSNEYRQRGGTVYCGRECSSCCSLVVNCTFPEAVQIAAALNDQQTDRLQRQIAPIRSLADQAETLKDWLTSYRQQGLSCPFLDEAGCCGIYPVRPLSCRSLLSTQQPHWCAVAFSSLTSKEKQDYMDSLDRSAVAFPTHYAATPQEIGRELEEAVLRKMETVYNFSLLGSLPWLVWLEQEYTLSSRLSEGPEAVQDFLKSRQALNRFLIVISCP